jgi:hypothetical protein
VRQTVSQVSDETNATDRFKYVFFLELFADENGIDFAATLKKRNHGDENPAM